MKVNVSMSAAGSVAGFENPPELIRRLPLAIKVTISRIISNKSRAKVGKEIYLVDWILIIFRRLLKFIDRIDVESSFLSNWCLGWVSYHLLMLRILRIDNPSRPS